MTVTREDRLRKANLLADNQLFLLQHEAYPSGGYCGHADVEA